jgi:hypothetical protein
MRSMSVFTTNSIRLSVLAAVIAELQPFCNLSIVACIAGLWQALTKI